MTPAFFQHTFDALPAQIAILDREANIVAVNAAWKRSAKENGLKRSRHGVGMNYLAACDRANGPGSDFCREVAEGIRAVTAGRREEFCLDYPCHGPDAPRWFELRVRGISRRGAWRVLVIHENITGKKLAELELRDRERRLSLAIEAGGLGAFERVVGGDRIKVSRRFCLIADMPAREEVPYHEWVDRVFHEDQWRLLAEEERMLETKVSLDIEYRLRCNGGIRWVRMMCAPEVEEGEVRRVFGVLQDISAGKFAEAELRRTSSVVEQSPVSVVITDSHGDIQYVNPKFCALTGYSVAEVLGRNPRFLKSGEMSEHTYQELWDTITGGGVWYGEFHNRRKNGELFWERGSIFPIRDRNGAITHYASVKKDITECKRSEAALRESEERYRGLFERSLECMYVHDFEGRFIDLNPAALALLGYSREDLADLNFGSVLVEGELPKARQVIEEVVATGAHLGNKEFTVRSKSGALIQVECRSALLTRNGAPFAIQGVARDITERKREDEALREQLALRERLAKIAANAPGMIYTFRLRPDGTGCVPYASAAIEDLFGVSPGAWAEDSGEFVGLLHAEDRERVLASVHESARAMTRWRCEFRVRHPRRGIIWLEGQATPERDVDGGTIWHGFMSDISERKRTESALAEHKEKEERAQRALEHEKELNQVKSQFVSLVSHEFRSPLCVINMAAAMLDEYFDRLAPEDRSRNLRQIQRAVVRMTRMMEDLLVHERLTMGMLENAPASVNFEALCRAIVPEVTSNPDQITVEVAEGLTEVMLDEPLITHVLTNLLGNAVKYSAENAPILLKAHRSGPATEGTQVCVTVSDRGIGIPAEELPLVFQAFHRCSNVENRPGTGMGLPIVKQCVELLGGTIRLESRVGEGTTAHVRVPCGRPHEESSAPARSQAGAHI